MRIDSTDGVTLAVHDLGGEGEPLLICHAAGFHGRTYAPLADVAARNRKVWAVDFRAHGDSTSPVTGRFSWDGVADDLLAVIDGLTGPGIDVFGHSLGGAATLLAERRRPGVVRRAYLFEPIVLPGEAPWPAGENPLAVAARRRRPTFPSKAEALWRYANRPPLATLNAAALAAYVNHGFTVEPDGTARLKLAPEDEAAIFNQTGLATTGTVRGLAVPAIVARGADDGGPAAFAPLVADVLADAELVTFPHLGHFGPLQSPAELGVAALAWFDS